MATDLTEFRLPDRNQLIPQSGSPRENWRLHSLRGWGRSPALCIPPPGSKDRPEFRFTPVSRSVIIDRAVFVTPLPALPLIKPPDMLSFPVFQMPAPLAASFSSNSHALTFTIRFCQNSGHGQNNIL